MNEILEDEPPLKQVADNLHTDRHHDIGLTDLMYFNCLKRAHPFVCLALISRERGTIGNQHGHLAESI